MPAVASWKLRALRYVTPILLASLVLQYLAGLYTNVYGGFSTHVDSPSLGLHFLNGNILFLVSVIVVIFAALARAVQLLVLGVVVSAMVLIAGQAGMAFVHSVQTIGATGSPIYSFIMGVAFLVAFSSAVSLAFLLYGRGSRMAPVPAETSPA